MIRRRTVPFLFLTSAISMQPTVLSTAAGRDKHRSEIGTGMMDIISNIHKILIIVMDIFIQKFHAPQVFHNHPLFLSSTATKDFSPEDRSKQRQLLSGKIMLVTGANTGVGLETCKMLARNGATIIMACRSKDKAESAINYILLTEPSAKLLFLPLDLSSLESVRSFAQAVVEHPQISRIDAVILNAGVMSVAKAKTCEGRAPETHFGVNHLAHCMLVLLLLPSLCKMKQEECRIIVLSSLAHILGDLWLDDIGYEKRNYNSFGAYGTSKLCNILFVHHLSFLISKSPYAHLFTINAVHPGEVVTDISRNLGTIIFFIYKKFIKYFLLTPEEGAKTSVFMAAAEEMKGQTNQFKCLATRDCLESEQAKNPKLAEELWMKSIEMCGFTERELASLEQALGFNACRKLQ